MSQSVAALKTVVGFLAKEKFNTGATVHLPGRDVEKMVCFGDGLRALSEEDYLAFGRAIEEACAELPTTALPVTVSRAPGEERVSVSLGGCDVAADALDRAMPILEAVRRVKEQLPVQDEGGHQFYIGAPGGNLVTNHVAMIAADSPAEAVAKLIASRIIAQERDDLTSSDVIEPGDREMVIRRSHDWAKTDYQPVHNVVSGLFDLELECQREIDFATHDRDLDPSL